MSASDEVPGEALRLVRHAMHRDLAGQCVTEDLLPGLVRYLALLSAGLLADLAHATGEDPEAVLDLLEVKSMEATLR